jgi:hypothetical protein
MAVATEEMEAQGKSLLKQVESYWQSVAAYVAQLPPQLRGEAEKLKDSVKTEAVKLQHDEEFRQDMRSIASFAIGVLIAAVFAAIVRQGDRK